MNHSELFFGIPSGIEVIQGTKIFTAFQNRVKGKISIGPLADTGNTMLTVTKINGNYTSFALKELNTVNTSTIDLQNGTGGTILQCTGGIWSFFGTVSCTTLSATGNLTVGGGLNSSNVNATNLYCNVFGQNSPLSVSQVLFAGASNIYNRIIFSGTTSNAGGGLMPAGVSFASVIFAGSSVGTAATGTHSLFAQCVMKPMVITNSGATITDTAMMYIEAAMTGGTNNYSLFIDAGKVRIDDNVAAPTPTAGVAITNFYGANATNFLGDPNLWLRMNVGGTDYKIPLYT